MNEPKDLEAAETNQTESIKAVDPAAICSGWRKALPDKAGWWWWRNENGHSDMVECQAATDGSIQRIEHDYYDHAYTEESSWWFGPVAMPEFNVPNRGGVSRHDER